MITYLETEILICCNVYEVRCEWLSTSLLLTRGSFHKAILVTIDLSYDYQP